MSDIRPERPGDAADIDRVHRTAFPGPEEAGLVADLRAAGRAAVSLVAVVDGTVVGHILLSPATPAPGLGLAPLAVVPAFQRRGIGSDLVRAGLEAARSTGAAYVVVLGDPAYYGRFGFRPAASLGLSCVFGGGDAFQVLALGSAPPAGRITYAPEFSRFP